MLYQSLCIGLMLRLISTQTADDGYKDHLVVLLMMFTVVSEEESREAAEERPQAGQEAVAVPGDHEDHEQLPFAMVTKTV